MNRVCKKISKSIALVLSTTFITISPFFTVNVSAASGVAINAENFPDSKFMDYILEAVDSDYNLYLSDAEIQAVDFIGVSMRGITDLKGVELFTNLTRLDCSYNQLKTLDVSKNKALVSLGCTSNELTSLDLSNNTSLTDLSCGDNELLSLDLRNNKALTWLSCGSNMLTSLDLSNNTKLESLECGHNKLTNLDLSNNTNLSDVLCTTNRFTTLDFSNNPKLKTLRCEFNDLTSINVSKNTKLQEFCCYENHLTSLDISNNTALTGFNCYDNQLTELNLSKNINLNSLGCSENWLTTLDLNNNTKLEYIRCSENLLTSIKVSNCTLLTYLYCENNQLTNLDVSKNTALSVLDCRKNYFTNKPQVSNSTTLLFDPQNELTPLSITTQPNDFTGSLGSTATFKVVAKGTGLKYQWQAYSNGKWVNSSLTGAKTSTLSVPITQARNGYKFRCVITDVTNNTVTSNTVTLKVAVELSITTQPKNYTGAVGSTAKFKVVAQGTGLKYQWQVYSNGKWVNSSLNGAKTSTLSVPVTQARNGYKFRCVITDVTNKTVTSNAVTLKVNTTPLSITTQPKSYTGNIGNTAKFSVKAQGAGLKYQWQVYKNGKWVNSSLNGANTSTLSVPVTQARNGYKFRCVITDITNKTVTSNTVTLKVAVELSITTQPKNYTGAVGSTAKFKVVAQGTGLKYQWQTYTNGKWTNSSLTGSKTSTLSVPVTRARNGYKFRCVITDSSGKKITSNSVTLKVS